jgi:hypothetical protein
MSKSMRMTGAIMVAAGVLIVLSYFFVPLGRVLNWFWLLPVQLQIGFGVAAIGLTVLIISLLAERWKDRHKDKALRDETPTPS